MPSGESFSLPARYKCLKHVGMLLVHNCGKGKGTYGTVISAQDLEQNKKVAIKKLRRVNDVVDAKRILREIRILKALKHENILGLSDVFYVPQPQYRPRKRSVACSWGTYTW